MNSDFYLCINIIDRESLRAEIGLSTSGEKELNVG